MTQTSTAPQLKAALRQFTGSEKWFRHPMFRSFSYTEGVRYLAEQAGAYWLIDAILACQTEPKVQKEPFQVWQISVNKDHSAVLTCTDGNCGDVYRQDIAYTDFPLQTYALWLTNNVLLLPSEY